MAKQVKVTQRKRPSTEKQKIVLLGMGLKKIDGSKVLPDTPATRGMINRVAHLIEVEELR